jgi:hypothetical protein
MRELVENILTGNNVEAHKIFESRLNQIIEKKLYEMKRMIQAEVFGGMSKEDLQKRKDAGFFKAADYYEAMQKLKDLETSAKAKKEEKPKSKKKDMKEQYRYMGKSEKDIESAAAGAGERLGKQAAAAAKAIAGERPSEPEEKTPRDMSSIRSSAWSDKKQKSKIGPYLKRIEDKKRRMAQQGRVDTIAKQAIGNLVRGKNIGKNIGRIAKYGTQSSPIKSIKGGHDVWMGKKEPTTLKGKGIALVRDILSHPGG